jgi:hypothetical protein
MPAITYLPARSIGNPAARRASTPATSVLNSTVPRLSSMGLHAAEQARASAAQRGVVEPGADDGLGGLRHQHHGRRHRAQRDAGLLDHAASAQGQADPRRQTAMSISVRGVKRR